MSTGLDPPGGPLSTDYTPFGGWQLGIHLLDDHLQFSANGDKTGFTNWETDLTFGAPRARLHDRQRRQVANRRWLRKR